LLIHFSFLLFNLIEFKQKSMNKERGKKGLLCHENLGRVK
jgi:hypothetical protein